MNLQTASRSPFRGVFWMEPAPSMVRVQLDYIDRTTRSRMLEEFAAETESAARAEALLFVVEHGKLGLPFKIEPIRRVS